MKREASLLYIFYIVNSSVLFKRCSSLTLDYLNLLLTLFTSVKIQFAIVFQERPNFWGWCLAVLNFKC